MKKHINKNEITPEGVIRFLKKNGSKYNRDGMARFGINVDRAFGVNVQNMRAFAKRIGKNHMLASELWNSGYHEARHIAAMIDDPAALTKSQMNKWVKDFNSWDICDGTCLNLFRKSPYAFEMIFKWADRKEEYVRRAAFSLIATLSVHEKNKSDEEFLPFFELIKKHSTDERNFVRKSVNWALRQIGKRSLFLRGEALNTISELKLIESKSARWIAADAFRELNDEKIISRIKIKTKRGKTI